MDIVIADAIGTRTYETYSGGEAFRINFAIRLALAKLLAQRAGAALQLLIIDEGFGIQDAEGCDLLPVCASWELQLAIARIGDVVLDGRLSSCY